MEKASKAVGDLDDLVKAVLSSLPSSKPWQRQLRRYLVDIDTQVQVLRMAISIQRGHAEKLESVAQLRTVLRVAQRYLAAGRADLGTKAAVGFACELGQRIAGELDAQDTSA